MSNIDVQKAYWDSVADKKTFTHPICMSLFQQLVPVTAPILDFGCGYGRTCKELVECGYREVVGIDISPQMIIRAKTLDPTLELHHFDGTAIAFPDESFSACTLLAVLTCIPTNAGQTQLISEIHRVLRPGGLLYISDYPIQKDARNQQRYRQYENEFGVYGTFRLSDGGVVRHHDMRWIHQLLCDFAVIREEQIETRTMNGNVAEVFQLIVKKGKNGQESRVRDMPLSAGDAPSVI